LFADFYALIGITNYMRRAYFIFIPMIFAIKIPALGAVDKTIADFRQGVKFRQLGTSIRQFADAKQGFAWHHLAINVNSA
jgi:hypothetical protein